MRARIPTNHNPFHYHDRTIISIDTLKQAAEYRTYLETARWDIIVIDEAHNVADRGTGSLRSRLARLLARRSDTLIMLSATPHDGKARSFASLMNMLDATAITDPASYTTEDFRGKGLVIRRFKKDVQEQVRDAFRDREIFRRKFPASPEEEAAYKALLQVQVADNRSPRRATTAGGPRRDLFLVTLEKALFSSPAACRASIEARIRRRRKQTERTPDPAIEAEVASLRRLEEALRPIGPANYAKYRALLAAIRGGRPFRWRPTRAQDRLVIFTERIETLRWLKDNLSRDLGLRIGRLGILHGGMSDVDQQEVVEHFGNARKGLRLLIASDVASEGINLHYQCHRLIHFDMPWSLMVFSQRNGRVDRYGQKRAPKIVYLVTESANATIRGDTRILEILEQKDEQAYRNIGDPSAFMRVRDIAEEERITEDAIAAGRSAEDFDADLQPSPDEGDALLQLFLTGNGATNEAAAGAPAACPDVPRPAAPLSLYRSELDYCEAALQRLRARRGERGPAFRVNRGDSTLTLDAPENLRDRFRAFPREVLPKGGRLTLTTDRNRMNEAIAESRRDEDAWPRVHYLWPLNPVVGWLNDRMLAAFGRHEAPILAGVPGLAADETVFLCSGLIPNRKSHPLVYEWVGVVYRGRRHDGLISLDDLLHRTGLGRRDAPNRGFPVDEEALRRLLPDAVERATGEMVVRRNAFEDAINDKLEREMAALDQLQARQQERVRRVLSDSTQPSALQQGRARSELRRIEEVFGEYLDWIQDTMTTEPHPWIQVVAVLTGDTDP